MTDLEFIHCLMSRDTTGLALLSQATIDARWTREGLYIIQLNSRIYRAGFLLYAHPNEERTVSIDHFDLDLNPPDDLSAKHAVKTLVDRARARGAENILFRAPSTLDEIQFWTACGFTPIAITATGSHRQASTVQYEMVLSPKHEALNSGRLRDALRPNA